MKHHLLPAVLLAALTACAPSPEERALENAGRDIAARVWTEPGVADAIGLSGTFVAKYNADADILFRVIPKPLGMSTYGRFDYFELVMFSLEDATHAQVLAGMSNYCRQLGKRLTNTTQGVMDPLDGTPPRSGHVTGRCI